MAIPNYKFTYYQCYLFVSASTEGRALCQQEISLSLNEIAYLIDGKGLPLTLGNFWRLYREDYLKKEGG